MPSAYDSGEISATVWRIIQKRFISVVSQTWKELFERGLNPIVHPVEFTDQLILEAAKVFQGKIGEGQQATINTSCISLLGDGKLLLNMVRESAAFVHEDEAYHGRLNRVVARAFHKMRRSYLDPDPAGTGTRIATWERLNRISKELWEEYWSEHDAGSTQASVGRCTEGHFKELAAHIRATWPNDRNLPRTAMTIGDYFHEFCDDCRRPLEALYSARSHRIEGLPGVGNAKAALAECLLELSEVERRLVWEIDSRGDWKQKVANLERDYGLRRKDLLSLREKIRRKLRRCLELKGYGQ